MYMSRQFEYVAFDRIKQTLQAKSVEWSDHDERNFVQTLWQEAEKVDLFVTKRQREMEATLAHCRRDIEQNHSFHHRKTLDTIWMQIHDLADYAWQNFLALQSLTQIHHETTGHDQKQLLVDIMRSRPLDRRRFDVLLLETSKLLDLVSPRQESPAAVQFWIHPENLNQVLAILQFHMPSSTARLSINYLDSSNFELYQACLERDENAKEVRVKHYSGSHEVFVEREVYQADGINGQSIVDGFRLDASDKANCFLEGRYTAEECVNDLCHTSEERRVLGSIASEIEQLINYKHLKVMARMTCEEITFGSQVILNRNIVFTGQEVQHTVPYAVLQANLNGTEELWLKTLLEDGLIYEVPCFSLFLHGIACLYSAHLPFLPQWYDEVGVDIRDSRQLKGSKVEKLRTKNCLGYLDRELENPRIWPTQRRKQHNYGEHEAISIDSDSIRQHSDGEEQKHSSEEENSILERNNDDRSAKEKKKKKKKKNRNPMLEPKVFFANERTFIHWLQFSALILVAALTLLNFGDGVSTIAGGVFFGISMAIALYAYGRFRYRAHQIRTRPTIRYDDIYGPIGLCILLVGAITLNTALRYTHPATPGTWLGINNTTQQQ